MVNRTKISKTMAYLLRHNPSGIEISDQGFVEINELLEELRDKWPDIRRQDVMEVVEKDPKGRYEVKDGKVRARYGHSIKVNLELRKAKVDTLYHGTTEEASMKILENGLKSKGRQKVHLSSNIDEAIQVGKRRTNDPVVLEIDAEECRSNGIKIEKASDEVYVSKEIPPKYISPLNDEHNSSENQ